MRLIRSALYVPGNSAKMLQKARAVSADALLLDLEDAVSAAGKDEARALVVSAFSEPWPADKAIFVRLNALSSDIWERDLESVLPCLPAGLVIPKVESAEQVCLVDRKIAEVARATGVDASDVALIAMLETALGILRALEIATASPRVCALLLGSEDLTLDAGLQRTPEGLELLYARSQTVFAATAAGIQTLDGVWADIANLEGLRRESMRVRSLGFSGKSLIHPSHVPVVNEVFSPSQEEIERARRLVSAFAASESRGIGAISFEGQMVDRPHLEKARRLLRVAGEDLSER
ncbi:MAG: CoA ester lyase [Chloroflexota bacterium]|nr:MAG: CoA ester lyase [Chloroflexota bacterium]